ncbi:hypothetical protein CL653_02870 [bacterium]|nr:hypothetical protein [bacterium]
MIRTRDFLIYIGVLLLLLVGTTLTGVTRFSSTGIVFAEPNFDLIPVAPEAYVPEPDENKADRLAWFRSLIKVNPAPSDDLENDDLSTLKSVEYCSGHRTLIPSRPIKRLEVGGDEISLYNDINTTEPFVVLPVRSIRSTFDTCLPDNIIGVTANRVGDVWKPLLNSDISKYSNYQANQLVGYARDGFPIYGMAEDTQELDSCGGHYVDFSYRYQLQADAEGIILCYAGLPELLEL